jgi:hypothetical protein
LTVGQAAATLTLGDLAATYDGSPHPVSVTTNPPGLTGVVVTYTLNGAAVASPTRAGSYQVMATLNNLNYTAPAATGTLVIGQATPTITWANPTAITYGTPLGPAQLDATASAPGDFTYNPAVGKVLTVGNGQQLAVSFTPTDTTDFTSTMDTVTINVAPGIPLFDSLSAPTIAFGTASTTLSGHIAAGVVIPPGNVAISLNGVTESAPIDPAQGTFSASFPTAALGTSASPYTIGYAYTGTADFTAATSSTSLTVSSATPTLTWTDPGNITQGTALDSTELDAAASFNGQPLAGTFAYSPPAGTVLPAGNGQTLMVTFTPTDSADFQPATASVLINVTPQPISTSSPTPTPTSTSTSTSSSTAASSLMIVNEQPVFRRPTNRRGKPAGKPVLAGFTFTFNTALDPSSAGNLANYQVDTVAKRGKSVSQRVLQPFNNIAVAYDAANDAVTLTLVGKLNFPTGGQITIIGGPSGGITGTSGATMANTAVFTVSKGGKSIVPE